MMVIYYLLSADTVFASKSPNGYIVLFGVPELHFYTARRSQKISQKEYFKKV